MPFPLGRLIGSVISVANNKIKGVRSKLAALEDPNDGRDFGALTYPLTLDQQSGHFIMFHVVETSPGSGRVETQSDAAEAARDDTPVRPYRGLFGGTANVGNTNLTRITGQDIAQIQGGGPKRVEATRNTLKGKRASVSNLTQFEVRTETVATVVIYMPEKITTGYAMEYQGESLRIAAAGKGIFDLTRDLLGGATTLSAENKADLIKSLGEEATTRLGTQLIDQLGSLVGANVGARAFLEKSVRRVINPHMQFLFRSVNQRTFEYTFQFVPQSAQESEVVDNIIRTFKFFAHPELVDTAGRLHGYPAEFDIQYVSRELKPTGTRGPGGAFHFQENDWLNRVGRCYLASIAVDYTAAGVFATHRHHSSPVPGTLQGETAQNRAGNPPTHITMTLTFNELETLNRQHILEGF